MRFLRSLISILLILVLISWIAIYIPSLDNVSGQSANPLDGVYVRIVSEDSYGVLQGYLIDGDKLLVSGGYIVPLQVPSGYNYTVEVMAYGYELLSINYNGSQSNISANLTPAPLIHGYVVGPDGRGIPNTILLVDPERMVYAVTDSNGYYAFYSPYPLGSSINISLFPNNHVLDLDEFLDPDGYIQMMTESGWDLGFNRSQYEVYPIYPYVLTRGGLGRDITNLNITSQSMFLNITLNYSYIYETFLEFGDHDLQDSFVSLARVFEDGSKVRATYGFFDRRFTPFVGEFYTTLSSGIEGNYTYVHTLVYIHDREALRTDVDEVFLDISVIESTQIDYLEIQMKCYADWGSCVSSGLLEGVGYLATVTGEVVFNNGEVPPNIYVFFLGNYNASSGDGAFRALYRVYSNGTFKGYVPLPLQTGSFEYYVVLRAGGTLVTLASGVMNAQYGVQTIDLGQIQVSADVHVIRGFISDYNDVPEPMEIYAVGFTDDPSMMLIMQGWIYENGSFEIPVIQNLNFGGTSYQYTYSIDIVSNFYCQLKYPDYDNISINGDIDVGGLTCLPSPLEPLRIDVYPTAPPLPSMQQYFRFLVGVNTTEYTYRGIIYQIDEVIEVYTLPDSNGAYYPIQMRFGALYRDIDTGSGRLAFVFKSLPGQEVRLRMEVKTNVFSSGFTASLAYAGIVKPLTIDGLGYNETEGTMIFNLYGGGEGISAFTYLIIDSTEVVPEFQPLNLSVLAAAVSTALYLVRRVRRLQ